MKNWHCDPCGKDLKSYHGLWKHKKICKARQRVLCTNCSKVMSAMDYKNHHQNCGKSGVLQNVSNGDLYKKLQDAGKDTDHDDKQDGEMTTDSEHERDADGSNPLEIRDADDSNQPEDDEDEQMDDKIWNVISHWCIENREDALDGFRYWFQFCHKLDHDPTIQKIMESVQSMRDDNDSLSFKDALDLALRKRKFLIYETLKAFKTEGIWKTLLEEPDKGLDVFQWLKKYILVCRSMKRDPLFNSVNSMIEELMQSVDAMDFEESLNYSIEKKADEIFEAVGNLPRRDNAVHVWDRISKNFNPSMPNADWEVRYFINMQILIEEDGTFEIVLNRIDELLECGETLDVALYNAIKENQSLIHDSFVKGDELWTAMKADEFGIEKEELDIFEIYVLYYLALKQDGLFQSIMNDIHRLMEDGLDYTVAVNHVMNMKKVDIRNVIGNPFIPGLRYLQPIRF